MRCRGLTYAVLAAVFALSGGALAASASADAGASDCPDADLVASPPVFDRIAAATLCLVNKERVSAGLRPLQRNDSLDAASAGMAGRMAREHFFSHVTPDGVGVLARAMAAGYGRGFDLDVVGENLGVGTGWLSTPSAMVSGWMNSPEHRGNILEGDYNDAGLGLAQEVTNRGDGGRIFYVMDFGARTPASTAASSPHRREAAAHRRRRTRRRSHARHAHRGGGWGRYVVITR